MLFSPFHSVILSLEVKLHLLHSYMNVKWIPVSSDAQVRTLVLVVRDGRTKKSGGSFLRNIF